MDHITKNQLQQLLFVKPIRILRVEDINIDRYPEYPLNTPILHVNAGNLQFLSTGFVECQNSSKLPIIHLESVIRNSCGLFTTVLDDEFYKVRLSAIECLKSFGEMCLENMRREKGSR